MFSVPYLSLDYSKGIVFKTNTKCYIIVGSIAYIFNLMMKIICLHSYKFNDYYRTSKIY